ncbi:uncharacterized protein RCO7_14044 [Rhynchosporium graminicola]|uniref:Uncharacterized protein n=1 Tax=Rhynchosporium graminicola TaxID=2792576 RepID=A0A1E1LJB4_9HELO|nr:uncharacterized protein RCO7_14044 [Rhynchosporium commune]
MKQAGGEDLSTTHLFLRLPKLILLIIIKEPSRDLFSNLDTQPNIFRLGYYSKVLDPPKEDPSILENYRTITIKCLYRYCNKTLRNLRVNELISNLFTHYKHSHKAINLRFLSDNNIALEESFNREGSTTSTISQFTEENFKRLLLNFIILNNISFRAISSLSFNKLVNYLNNKTPPIYYQMLKNKIISYYNIRKDLIKEELLENISSKGSHFINSDLDLKSYLLSIVPLESIYSSRYMNKVLINTLKDYDIEYNITSITRDNASSNNLLIDTFKEEEEESEEEDLPRNINYSIWKHIRTIIISLKYNQENRRLFEGQLLAYKLESNRKPQLVKLYYFSKSKAFKNIKSLKSILYIIEEEEEESEEEDLPRNINYSIWKHIRTIIISLKYNQENRRLFEGQLLAYKLESNRKPQLVPEVYIIYNRLDKFKEGSNISLYS